MKTEKSASLSKLKAELPQIIKYAPTEDAIHTEKDFIEKVTPGSSVLIQSLNQDGIVQGVPNSKGEVPVLSKSMRIQIHWKDLIPKKVLSSVQTYTHKTSEAVPLQEEELQIDLRGLTADDAIIKLERALDKAMRDQVDKVKIIHGHGSNALKKNVRSYLSRSLYIQKWQAGGEFEGDGITWADLA